MPEPLFCAPVIRYRKMTGDYNIFFFSIYPYFVIRYRKMTGDYNTITSISCPHENDTSHSIGEYPVTITVQAKSV